MPITRGRENAIYVHVAVLTPLHTGEKKIKPVAAPVGFKVVNGYRRIGNRQCLKSGAAVLASALAEILA